MMAEGLGGNIVEGFKRTVFVDENFSPSSECAEPVLFAAVAEIAGTEDDLVACILSRQFQICSVVVTHAECLDSVVFPEQSLEFFAFTGHIEIVCTEEDHGIGVIPESLFDQCAVDGLIGAVTVFFRIEIAGERPSILSTFGFSICPKNCLA